MIEVAPDTACMLYLGFAILAVMAVWLRYHLLSKKKEIVSFTIGHKTCEFCHFHYLDDASNELSRCPQCRFLNQRR